MLHTNGRSSAYAGLHQTPGRRPAVAHLQLDVGRDDALTPASAIIFSSSSASELQCTKVMVGPSSFFCASARPVLAPFAVAEMAGDADPSSAASAQSFSVTRMVAN